jgi:sulfite reductase (NADPH) hemoprotein beta-component
MYQYNDFDAAFIAERNRQFRAQVERRIDGSLTEDEFKPLRLMNGLYLQLHAYMLRVAISPPAPISSITGRNCATFPICSTRWPRWRCTPSRPPATPSAT